MTTTPVFERLDHDRYQPTDFARGPWDPRAMHGGAPSALLAGVLEAALAQPDDPLPMHPSRLTIDLERPVGIVPLTVRAKVVRGGRKVRIAEAEVFDDAGTRLARATLLGIRTTPEPLDLTDAVITPVGTPPPARPSSGGGLASSPFAQLTDGPLFHSHAVEHCFVRGEFGGLGPGTDWIRFVTPVVGGEPTTPLQRVAGACDFGNGVSAALPPGWIFINPDLSITLQRLPVGEWVCLDSVTLFGTNGYGSAESELWDEQGRLGRSIQNLLIEPPAC
ncbi:MAG: thioesterase family protein [Actinomycetota bacterium]|nr:thioesterase family protein [Actinomycetota bacterium]